ncbi:helix-turn-helix domain-containing protein [Glycomyces sp. NPDC048151]|uniref:helix-turn-helix domain-containing protein n=1 Tax=Glycomyces sp. NPDC048151 TaxID=3364002 RepID=UPI00372174CD
MAEPREPTWRAKWLGQKLRALRKNKNFTIADVADRLGCSTATVNRFELGTYPLKGEEMLMLLNMFSLPDGGERDELFKLAKEVAERGWVESLVSKRSFADFVWAESKCRRIRSFQLAVFPGSLQAPEYAEALIESGPNEASAKVALVEARLARGRALAKPNAPEARFLLHESMLHQRIEGFSTRVYRKQFERLLEATEQANVELRVAPLGFGAHTALGVTTGFTILDMPDSWPMLAHVETPLGGMVAETPDVDSLTDAYESLWEANTLDEKRTRDQLARMLKELD